MIKVAELRLGNYCYDSLTGEWLRVIALSTDNVTTSVINREKFPLPDGWKAEPIQLTEDILLKFGFENSVAYKKNGLKIGLDGDDIIHGQYSVIFEDTLVKVKYLHQLQNLYYALTGDELEF